MSLKDLDLVKLTKLTSKYTDHLKCIECCKYYIAPTTAACGHTLCHTCWCGRRGCPLCGSAIDRKSLKLNSPLQNLTNHIQTLAEAFETLFQIQIDEFTLDTSGDTETDKDPVKHVKDWLTSSQNHFSAPIQSSDTFSQDSQQPQNPVKISASNIVIHPKEKKGESLPVVPKFIHVQHPQDDWDKIEKMSDEENKPNNHKTSENIVGPMDIEPFSVDDSEYTSCNPRRSSRKRDIKNDDSNQKLNEFPNKGNSKDSSCEIDKKSQKSKQTWNSAKRMRKEFSKLNKKNRGKLNVSIEMVKKTLNLKPNTSLTASQNVVNIDENTPENMNKENEVVAANKLQTSKDLHTNSCENIDVIANKSNAPLPPVVNKSINNSVTNNSSQDKVISHNNSSTQQRISCTTKEQELINKTNINFKEVNRMPFIKKSALCPKNIEMTCDNEPNVIPPQETIETVSDNSEDIEISIKIGTIITNVLIKRKNDVQVKINSDREVQTSLGPHYLNQNQTSANNNGLHNTQVSMSKTNSQEAQVNGKESPVTAKVDKSTSEKKNTASAETATVQFEITESVEKELSNIMEYETVEGPKETIRNENNVSEVQQVKTAETGQENVESFEDLNDLDIFSGSVKEANVHTTLKNAPSEILISTVGSRLKTQKNVEKRNRENTEDEVLPKSKKIKTTSQKAINDKDTQADSEPVNYDVIMGQVFASIDADMEDIRKSQDVQSTKDIENNRAKSDELQNKSLTQANKTKIIKYLSQIPNTNSQMTTKNIAECIIEKHSENIFSILEKDDDHLEASTDERIPQQVPEMLTPLVCEHLDSLQDSNGAGQKTCKSVKGRDNFDDSDRSVVEETPQKDVSYLKGKRTSISNVSQMALCETKKIPSKPSDQSNKSIITLTDTERESSDSIKDVTLVEQVGKKMTLETPLTITTFADHIIHKSTPVARKSLNFDNEDNDPEQTLCPTSDIIAKNTQEKEIMCKAFENTPTTPSARPLLDRNVSKTIKKFCLAGSRLTSDEIGKIKIVCAQQKWRYFDNYTKDITHLVVSVDEENKSQRSVKYMCALADSKWIVSFAWIERCLKTKSAVDEKNFEALDSFGEPGPRRSRIAKQKLFQGIKFYCMPPFSVLDVNTLKDMLTAAGGLVVNEVTDVRVTKDNTQPALLLAEPENTQEDRFIYLAMEHSLVPVNFEWVLNCLGSYSLGSIQNLLLCPSSLLPEATARWPEVLLSQDYE